MLLGITSHVSALVCFVWILSFNMYEGRLTPPPFSSFIEVELIYKIVIIFAVPQSDPVIQIHIPILSQINSSF